MYRGHKVDLFLNTECVGEGGRVRSERQLRWPSKEFEFQYVVSQKI